MPEGSRRRGGPAVSAALGPPSRPTLGGDEAGGPARAAVGPGGGGWLGAGWAGRVERTSVADGIFESVREAIVDGRLAASTRLGEKDLAAQFRVSRTPVREVLRRLEQRRLVTAVPTGGYLVAAWDPSEVSDLCRVRAVLERLVAGEAAVRATTDDVAALARALDVMPGDPPGDGSGGTRPFHRAIARIAGITLATVLLDQIADHVDRYQHHRRLDAERRALVRAEHQRILGCIRAGDRDGADRAMGGHLETAAAALARDLRPPAAAAAAPGTTG